MIIENNIENVGFLILCRFIKSSIAEDDEWTDIENRHKEESD